MAKQLREIKAYMKDIFLKYSLFWLLAFNVFSCTSDNSQKTDQKIKSTQVEIKLGENKKEVLEKLNILGAKDTSDGMQVLPEETTDKTIVEKTSNDVALKEWMWSIGKNYNIETIFENDKLKTLNFWDFNIIQRVAYHHRLEHHEISSLIIEPTTWKYKLEIIKTHNKDKGYPKK